ncbi:MAG: hypothetical protein U1F65_05395 [Verrucomicrobiota bacterium]
MTILIEKQEPLEYLNRTGAWSKNPTEGRPFPNMAAAYGIAKQEAIGRFNIVCYILETNQFVNLNVGRGKGAPTEPARAV